MNSEPRLKIGRNAPCPCGSGKKYKHCCGKADTRPPPKPNVGALLSEAAAQLQSGDAERCARLCEQVLRNDPRNAHASYLFGVCRKLAGDPDGAAKHMETAFANGLSDAAAWYQYAETLIDLNRAADAIAALEKAILAKSDFVEPHTVLGNVYFELDEIQPAEDSYRAALALDGSSWQLHHNLAQCLYRQHRTSEARDVIDDALSLAPERADALAFKANLFEADNLLEEAANCIEEALSLDPGHPGAICASAKLQRRNGSPMDAISTLRKVDPSAIPPGIAVLWYQEMARASELTQNYQEAFNSYGSSGEILRQIRLLAHDPQPELDRLNAIEKWVKTEDFDLNRYSPQDMSDGPKPVFVLGFLRSGTTLIERMLGRHSKIAGLGELSALAECEAAIAEACDAPFPAGLDAMDNDIVRDVLAAQRESYLTEARKQIAGEDIEQWFVDKAPLNSKYIVLLRLLFPDAPVIYVMRHPLDVVLSSYFENFVEPHTWSFSLDDTASYFVRLREHFEAVSGHIGRPVHHVRYEDLVADPKTTITGVLDEVGTEWEPACLDYQSAAEVARTASYEQVSRPIYTTSVERYRHYLRYIDASVVNLIEPVATNLGYSIEGRGEK